jgi:predicted acyl esterase
MNVSIRSCTAFIVALLFGIGIVPLCSAQGNANVDPPSVDMLWGVKIPLRDGVKLNATIYKPKEMPTPLPVIFTLTPYIGDNYLDRALYFARHGYVFALVDCRGRGNSGGHFEPFEHEGRDGYDVVEWLARQSWSNGKVTMWGGSYAGFDQWSTAKELPPHLATIVPTASVCPGKEAQTAHITLFHDAAHPSRLEVPIVK